MNSLLRLTNAADGTQVWVNPDKIISVAPARDVVAWTRYKDANSFVDVLGVGAMQVIETVDAITSILNRECTVKLVVPR